MLLLPLKLQATPSCAPCSHHACRRHFNALDDQASAAKPPAGSSGAAGTGPDPRRLSLTAAYRQMAQSLLAAGAEGEAAVVAATAAGAGATTPGPGALLGGGPHTPLVSKC